VWVGVLEEPELGALAVPGAELRLLEYADPRGRFAEASAGDPSRSWWRPLRPRELPDLLEGAGWTGVEVRDLQPEFVRWYRQLRGRITARRRTITAEFGRDWYEFVAREYAGVLDLVRAGALGGVLVRARAT
jgi:hypothetical protein